MTATMDPSGGMATLSSTVDSNSISTANPTSNPGTVQAKTSKYDFVKVRIYQHESSEGGLTGHYHVLSRYLVARSLTTTLLPKSRAIRISLRCKKRLVDSGRLDISAREWRQVLEEVVKEEEMNQMGAASGGNQLIQTTNNTNPTTNGVPFDLNRFQMIQWFQSSHTPLLIFLYGQPLIGSTALATKLGNHLNVGVLQARNAFEIASSVQPSTPHPTTPSAPLTPQTPLYLHPWQNESDLESSYTDRCRITRRALEQDIAKIVHDGRSCIIEGSYIDPTMLQDLLISSTTATSDATNSPLQSSTPIILTFHLTLPPTKQQLLLHNLSFNLPTAAPPSSASTVLATLSANPSALTSNSPPPPTAGLIWQNLRWLESIVSRRHQSWNSLLNQKRGTESTPTTTMNAKNIASSSTTISLDSLQAAVTAIHTHILEAMQSYAQIHMK